MPYPADLGTGSGRLVIDNSAPELDGDTYTLSEVVQPAEPPALYAIYPGEYTIGDPSQMLRVFGLGFDPTSRIVFAGNVERTTYVSEEELTTWINADVWLNPDPAIPVLVRTQNGDTDAIDFAVVAPVADEPEPEPEPAPE